MIRKFRAGLALQPVCIFSAYCFFKLLHFLILFSNNQCLKQIATAIFANSPFTEGKPNGYLSMRRCLSNAYFMHHLLI